MRWLLHLLLLLLILSCREQGQNHEHKKLTLADTLAIVKYAKALEKKYDSLNNKETKYYDSVTKALFKNIGEVDLSTLGHDAYRFIWERSFHNQYLYLLEKLSDKDIRLTTKLFVQAKGCYLIKSKIVWVSNDTVAEKTVQHLPIQYWRQFQKLINGSYYWLMAPNKEHCDGLDGATWTLQTNVVPCADSPAYQAVSIWSPNDGSFRQACLMLIKMSDLTKNEKRIY